MSLVKVGDAWINPEFVAAVLREGDSSCFVRHVHRESNTRINGVTADEAAALINRVPVQDDILGSTMARVRMEIRGWEVDENRGDWQERAETVLWLASGGAEGRNWHGA